MDQSAAGSLLFLFPLIILFSIIGAYTTSGSTGDVVIMIVFGVAGYLMKKFAYEPAPMVLGLVIGPLLETAIRRSMIMSKGHIGIFSAPDRGILHGRGVAHAIEPAPHASTTRSRDH